MSKFPLPEVINKPESVPFAGFYELLFDICVFNLAAIKF